MKFLTVTLSVLVCFGIQVNCESGGKILNLFLKFDLLSRKNKIFCNQGKIVVDKK